MLQPWWPLTHWAALAGPCCHAEKPALICPQMPALQLLASRQLQHRRPTLRPACQTPVLHPSASGEGSSALLFPPLSLGACCPHMLPVYSLVNASPGLVLLKADRASARGQVDRLLFQFCQAKLVIPSGVSHLPHALLL